MKTCTQCNQRIRADGSGLEREIVEHLENQNLIQCESSVGEFDRTVDKIRAQTSAPLLLDVVRAAEDTGHSSICKSLYRDVSCDCRLGIALKKYRESK